MPRRSLFVALAVVAVVGVAGCGGSEGEASRCEPAPAWFLEEFGDGFREEGRTLGDSAAVQSTDSFEGPLHIEKAWFVSVDVRPRPGIETFFMSDEIFRTGHSSGPGLITGAGPEPSAWGPGSPLDFSRDKPGLGWPHRVGEMRRTGPAPRRDALEAAH